MILLFYCLNFFFFLVTIFLQREWKIGYMGMRRWIFDHDGIGRWSRIGEHVRIPLSRTGRSSNVNHSKTDLILSFLYFFFSFFNQRIVLKSLISINIKKNKKRASGRFFFEFSVRPVLELGLLFQWEKKYKKNKETNYVFA